MVALFRCVCSNLEQYLGFSPHATDALVYTGLSQPSTAFSRDTGTKLYLHAIVSQLHLSYTTVFTSIILHNLQYGCTFLYRSTL